MTLADKIRDGVAGRGLFGRLLVVGLIHSCSTVAVGQPLHFHSPVAKEFRVIENAKFKQRFYSPPVTMDRLAAFYQKAGPEATIERLLRASVAGDFGSWLSLWDDESSKTFTREVDAGGHSKESWLKQWAATNGIAQDVELTRWIERGQWIAIAYRSPSLASGERAVGFNLSGGKWIASRALFKDPVVAYFTRAGDAPIERIVR